MHPDHSDEAHRALIVSLRTLHLPGTETDDEGLVAITIEQARLLLVTAGGLLGLTLTKLLDLDRAICIVPVVAEVIALIIALLLGWFGLLLGGRLRANRVDRRYAIYDAHLAVYMRAERLKQPLDYAPWEAVYETAFKREEKTSRTMQVLRWAAAILTAIGILMAAIAAVGTLLPHQCVGGTMIGEATGASRPM